MTLRTEYELKKTTELYVKVVVTFIVATTKMATTQQIL